MRREFKVGVLVSLSLALVVAVYIGRAVTRRSQPSPPPLAALTALPPAHTAREASLPPTQPDSEAAAASRPPATATQPDPDQELAKILETLATVEPNLPPIRQSLPAPSSTVAVAEPSAGAAEDAAISAILEKALGEPSTPKAAGAPATGPAQPVKKESDQPPAAGKTPPLAALDELDRLLSNVGETKAAAKPLAGAQGLEPQATSPDYTIEPGDSFWKIAEKVYGKGHLADTIASANPAIDPFNLQPGKKIAIPPVPQPAPTVSGASMPPSGARIYTVRPGETFWDIAAGCYGSGHKWRLIASANPGVNPDLLSVGTNLIIPEEKAASPAPAAPHASALAPGWSTHVIKPGESLWDIATKYYGSGTLYRAVLEANPEIGDVHHLPAGKAILIPPKPKEH